MGRSWSVDLALVDWEGEICADLGQEGGEPARDLMAEEGAGCGLDFGASSTELGVPSADLHALHKLSRIKPEQSLVHVKVQEGSYQPHQHLQHLDKGLDLVRNERCNENKTN